MPSPQPTLQRVTAKGLPRIEPRTWVVLAGILALGVLLRGARLAEAPGGFQAFDEGFYIDYGCPFAVLGLTA